MRPSQLLIYASLALFILGLGSCFVDILRGITVLAGAVLIGVAVADALLTRRRPKLRFQRKYQSRYAISEITNVEATITNRSKSSLTVRLYDGIPDHCDHEGYPFTQTMQAGEFASVTSQLTFHRRGDHTIAPAHLEYRSPLQLWWSAMRVGDAMEVQVYPNYVPALNYGLLATSDRLEQMGIVKKRNRGLSKEFHQLRDYQDGDPLNQIDWKASSRVNRLISREFQEERDQNVLLVADCSMRTKAVDRELPILDHLLNAMILISYMALKQGDKVSLMNFGTPASDHRYLAPVKGNTGLSKVLNHLYNYQSSKSYGDYAALAKRILSQPRKRSLVIILTNLRSEDQHGCVEALRLLSAKHLVLLASVQENSVMEIINKPIYTIDDANRYLGAHAYEQDSDEIVRALAEQDINVLRSPMDTLGVNLANRYLDLRATIAG